jgi:hypothetical protein
MGEQHFSIASPAPAKARPGGARLGRRACLARLGAAVAALAIGAPARGPRAAAQAARDSIYQRIWDADQAAGGIPAIAADQTGDPARGFVKVDERAGAGPAYRLFAEVRIPAGKRRTYDLCQALFDNYRLDQTKGEDNRPEEARETRALLDAVAESAPMALARAYLEDRSDRRFSDDAWQELIFELWFRQFDDGRNLDLSGFEHVAVGEQKGGTVNGHHFWYKYYLDDWAAFSGQDDIEYHGSRYDGSDRRDGRLTPIGRAVPEVVTLAYRWDAYDYDTRQRRALPDRALSEPGPPQPAYVFPALSGACLSCPGRTRRMTSSSFLLPGMKVKECGNGAADHLIVRVVPE